MHNFPVSLVHIVPAHTFHLHNMHRGLWASWEEGIPTSCVSTLLAEHASAGGVIVGWEIHGDLEVVGFEKARSEPVERRAGLCPGWLQPVRLHAYIILKLVHGWAGIKHGSVVALRTSFN